MGLLALYFMNYTAMFADPGVAGFMRQTDSPWVAGGPLLQVVRGLLFGMGFLTCCARWFLPGGPAG